MVVVCALLAACGGGNGDEGGDDDPDGGQVAMDGAGGGSDGQSGADTGSIPTDTRPVYPDGDAAGIPAPEIWRLGPGDDSWTSFDMAGRRSRFAPTSEIVAAFDIEHSNNVFVFTTSGVHVLRLEPPEWKEAQEFDSVAADLSGAEILAAYSDPDDSPDDEVTILANKGGAAKQWTGSYKFDDDSFSGFDAPEPVDWSSGDAPDPGAVLAAWRDNDNEHDWLTGDPPCDNAPEDEFAAYIGFLTASKAHYNDAYYCTDHFVAESVDQSPVGTSGVPSTDRIGAAFWHAGALYLIAKH